MSCLAHFEAVIDFGDDDREDDVSDAAITALLPKVNGGLCPRRVDGSRMDIQQSALARNNH
jgi:hypothetical protein